MEQLRLGRVPDPLGMEDEQDEYGLFKSSGQAYQQDVVPRSKGISPSAAPAPVAPKAGKFSFDLYGDSAAAPAPAPAPAAQQPKAKAFSFDLYQDQQPAPATQQTEFKEPGLDLGGSLKKGFKGLMVTWDFLANKLEKAVTGKDDDTSGILARGVDEYQKLESDPRIAELVKKGDDAPDTATAIRDMLGYALRNPTLIANFVAEQVPGAAIGGGIGGLAAAPLKSAAVNLATKAGAKAAVAGAVGAGATGAGINTGAVAFQSLGTNYVEGLRKYDGDEEAASEYAITKTASEVPANAIAGAFLGLAPFTSKLANVGLQGTIQGAGGAAGAAMAAGSVGEDIGRGELILEFLGEFATSPIDIIMAGREKGDKDESIKDRILKEAQNDISQDETRQRLFDRMMEDERGQSLLAEANIESADDPAFQTYVNREIAKAVGQQRFLDGIAPVQTPEELAEARKQREADVQAAFGETASTGTGVGTGAAEPVIRRDSVIPNEETRTLEGEAEPVVLPEGETTPAGTLALAPEDIVSRKQGYEVLPAFAVGEQAVANRFVSMKQAEAFLFGPVNKETGQREGGYASTVDDMEFQIRQGKRSKEAGGGSFYFIEGRAKPTGTQQIDEGANQAATSPLNDLPQPTEAQKAAGNYKKGNVKIVGLDIAVENPRGSERSGTDASGKAWKTSMAHHYGYVRRSKGKDGDQVDVFIGPNPESQKVFVVDQKNPDGSFDEHKVMLGFDTLEDAQAGYMANYSEGWQGMGAISEMPVEAFKSWVKDGKKRKPLAYQPPAPALAPAPAPAPAAAQQTATEAPAKTEPKKTVEQKLKDKVKEKKAKAAAPAPQPAPEVAPEVAPQPAPAPAPAPAAKKPTVEQTLKDKALQKGRLAQGKKQWRTYAPEDVKWEDLTPEAQKKWADAVADGKPNMALADELSPVKRDKEQEAADAKIGATKAPASKVIEFWEDQDDGSVPHVSWANLSKERQRDWKEAVEDGYASADLHDKLVAAQLQNERAERVASKITRDTEVDGAFRTSRAATGMDKADVETLFKRIITGWRRLPEVKIVQSESQLPIKLLKQIAKADISGKVPGMYHAGKVYLVADNLSDGDDVILTVAHEIAGHYGLRSILGSDYAKTMNSIYDGNKRVRKLADEMMVKKGLSREVAVEEVLADMAEVGDTNPEALSGLRALYAKLRQWLRDRFGVKFVSDNELRQLVANAREYVIEGKGEEGPGGTAAADAQAAAAQRATGVATFYSAMERAFRNPKISLDKNDATSAKQWKAWLKSKKGELGVKDAEIEWTGIENWFDLQGDNKLTKQQILNWIAGNRVKVNEVRLTSYGRPDQEDVAVAEFTEPDEFDMREFVRDQQESMDPVDNEDALASSPDDMDADALRDWIADNYGWRNYMHQHRRNAERFQRGRIAKMTRPKHANGRLVLRGGKNHAELVLIDPATQPYKSFDDIHYGDITEGKTIGWLRMNERKDANGNDVLFIEELQSQRGQDKRKGKDVPRTPFIEDTRSWTALLLKRAIAYAQERGIDRIAWTTGEQQNERYAFPGDELVYVKEKGKDTVTLTIMKEGREVRTIKDVPANNLQAYVGQRAAERITGNEGLELDNDLETSGVLKGDDLKVMEANLQPYYNQTVPSVAKDVLKKFGGSVQVMEIEGTGQQLGFVIPESLQKTVAEDGLPMFRRKDYEAQFDDLPGNVRDMAVAKGHYTPPTIRERLEALKPKLWLRIVQGTFDRFRAVRDIDLKAYMMLRLSQTVDGVLEGLLHYGQVFNDDGALNLKKGTKGLLDILGNVGPETDRFLLWIAANRAGELKKQDRERFFSDEEINALKRINLGKMKDGRSRVAVYAETLRGMNELNRSVLDVALQTGLIDEAAYKRFASDVWYIPFYRQMDDDGTLSAAQTSSASVGQYLSKKLKGSERQLNDLMENVLLNWSHILSASMKNQAANATLDAAQQMGGIVTKLDKQEKGAVKTMVNGKETFWQIDDEFLLASLDSVASIPSYGFFVNLAREFKTTLTRFIALSPTFKINNLIRDSIQSIGLTELNKNPIANVIQGMKAYENDRAEALVGGGIFALGNAFDGDRAANVKRLLKMGVPNEDIWSTDEKIKNGLKRVWNKYDEVSDALENANRLALYQQLRAKGASHLEASYAARDLQDFSLQGSFTAIRYLSQILPYFNARLQGMYKLGRDGLDPSIAALMGRADDSQRQKAAKFGVVLGAVTLAGLALYLGQMDDDDWKKREEWDRDAFFWFKIPGTETAIRIPKPFEMGAFATIIERLTEQMVDSDVEGKVFGKRLLAVLSDNLAINPIPQIVRPLYDIARNKDGFTDRPIESMGAERLSPENRVNAGTSAAAVAAGTINSLFAEFASAVTGGAVNADNMKLSPIQYDYLLRGYLGWLGTVIQTASTEAARPFKEGESPDRRIDEYFVIGNYVKSLPPNQSKYVTNFYENAKQIATATADVRSFIAAGNIEKAQEALENKRDLVSLSKMYSHVQDKMSTISKRIKQVQDDPEMPGEQKRLEMDRLSQLRIEYAKRAEEIRIAKQRGG